MPILPMLRMLIPVLGAVLLFAETRSRPSIRRLIVPLRMLITALHALLALAEDGFR